MYSINWENRWKKTMVAKVRTGKLTKRRENITIGKLGKNNIEILLKNFKCDICSRYKIQIVQRNI